MHLTRITAKTIYDLSGKLKKCLKNLIRRRTGATSAPLMGKTCRACAGGPEAFDLRRNTFLL
jgi:hypothetical protein